MDFQALSTLVENLWKSCVEIVPNCTRPSDNSFPEKNTSPEDVPKTLNLKPNSSLIQ